MTEALFVTRECSLCVTFLGHDVYAFHIVERWLNHRRVHENKRQQGRTGKNIFI